MASRGAFIGLLFLVACSGNVAEPVAGPTEVAPAQPATSQLHCVALAMYWEAKAEGDEGMLAVGHVIMNRAVHEQFPATPCAVVKQGGQKPPCQFSWWCDGKSDKPTELANWQRANELARELLTHPPKDNTRGSLFFHSTRLKNPWRVPRKKTVTIGGHVFYR